MVRLRVRAFREILVGEAWPRQLYGGRGRGAATWTGGWWAVFACIHAASALGMQHDEGVCALVGEAAQLLLEMPTFFGRRLTDACFESPV